MHQLLTIRDLTTLPEEAKNSLIEKALELSSIYFDFITNDHRSFEYTTTILGEKERAPGIHASEVSNCLRKLVHSIMETERRPSSDDRNMKMRFRLGHAVHAMVQDDWHNIAAQSSGRLLFVDEVDVSPALGGMAELWGIFSSCDGIITICELVGDEWVPIIRIGMEIKTESGPQFENLKSPRDYHRDQTCIYMATLDLPLMWIFYYNKSNSNITTSYPPWLFQYDHDLWEKLELRFVRAMHLAEIGQLPNREEGMYCKWCPFSWSCKPKIVQRRKRGTMPALSRGMIPGR